MSEPGTDYTRRAVLGALTALVALAAVGCKARRDEEAVEAGRPEAGDGVVAPAAAAMIVYRDPSCGCCEAWAEIARQAGYDVSLVDHPDLSAIKRHYGVPEELASCHTTIMDGFVIEGHVPMQDVQRLLAERPTDIKGIAVPGMPLGSPGMEVPDGTKQPFNVMAFDAAGQAKTIRAVQG